MNGPRLFFAVCLVCSLLAIGLLLTIASAATTMSAEAAAGQAIWRATDCEGCHLLYGQGGPFAPDLTHIYALRGPDYLREFLANPGAFYAGHRRMPSFGLTRDETSQVIAFLNWVGTEDLAHRWPPRTLQIIGIPGLSNSSLSSVSNEAPPTTPATRGAYWFSRPPANCATCHALAPDVVVVGPSLAGVATHAASRVPGLSAEEYMRQSIVYPDAFIVPGFQDVMQKNFGSVLTADQINDLIAFLLTLG